MRKPFRGLIIACITVIICIVAGYFALAVYYRGGFAANTWINGVYCTGSSVQEVNEQLLEQTDVPEVLTVIGYSSVGADSETTTWSISMEELKFTVDYKTNLTDYRSKQNPWVWLDNLSSEKNHVIQPGISFDELALLNCMDAIVAGFDVEQEYYIEYSQEMGYILHDGLHNRVDEEKVLETLKNAVLMRMDTVNLIECGCYYDLPLNETQQADCELWAKIDDYQKSGPVYDFGEGACRVSAGDMAGFLEISSMNSMPLVDKDGYFILKQDFGRDWVEKMAQEHDTYGRTWEFESTRGETLQIDGENYGTSINQDREATWFETYLTNLVKGKISSDGNQEGSLNNPRVPMYSRDAYSRGKELADTYIEVDFGVQKLYYYEEGKLMLETDIVSGNMRRRWDTPQGINYVYNKQKNRVLRGEGYATPVKFWMPVDGAIGIHDADWRDEFGGDEYKTNGSHGCVNVPKEVMPELYDMVEIGTPVIMFYGTDPETGDPIEWS